MGHRARLVVEERFSCRAQLERTEALYERLAAPHRSNALKAARIAAH
jgi:hypothetical protein